MRSSNGPNFPEIIWISRGDDLDSPGIFPSGVGFIAATSMNCDGKVMVPAAREIVTRPSSSGWRMVSSTLRLNSGNSSRNNTPLCAREISPGVGLMLPPSKPASLAYDVVNERVARDQTPLRVQQADNAVNLGCFQRFIKREWWKNRRQRFASMDLPVPGGLITARCVHRRCVSTRASPIPGFDPAKSTSSSTADRRVSHVHLRGRADFTFEN
jgi:hypothetical protein